MDWNDVRDIFKLPNSSDSSFRYSNDEELAELVWKNEPLNQAQDREMFIHEDEMISWLQNPYMNDCFFDQHLYLTQPLYFDQNDNVCPEFVPVMATQTAATNTAPRSVVRPSVMVKPVPEEEVRRYAGIFQSAPSNSKRKLVMDQQPVVGSTSAVDVAASGGGDAGGKRKRNGKEKENENDASAYKYDTTEIEILESSNTVPKKQVPGSTSPKRNRAAAGHSLSERKRRNRINERMKILQSLIPLSNKKLPRDKASMLEEAIMHLKSMKAQLQHIMEANMVPVMYPYIQQYMPIMGMGTGTETNPNPLIVPYPNMYVGPTFPMPVGDGLVVPACYVFPTFHVAPVYNTDPSRIQAINQPYYMQFPQEMHNYQPAMLQGTDNQRASYGFGNVDNLDPWKPALETFLKKRRKEEEEDKA